MIPIHPGADGFQCAVATASIDRPICNRRRIDGKETHEPTKKRHLPEGSER